MGVRARVSTTFALGSPSAIHRQLKPHGESVRHLVVENGKRSTVRGGLRGRRKRRSC